MKDKNDKPIFFIQIICSLLIVNYHTSILGIPYLISLSKGGFILNTIFVFFSGYLLSFSYSSNDNISFISFMLKRIKRIYPSLIIVLLISFVYSVLTTKDIAIYNYFKWFSGLGYFAKNNDIFSATHLWFVSVIMICYIIFIPSYRLITKKPALFAICVLAVILIFNYSYSENASHIYSNISSDKILRFIYHYLVFIIAIIWQVKNFNVTNFNFSHVITFILSLLGYAYFKNSDLYSIISVILVIPIIVSLIPILYNIGVQFENKIPIIFKLRTIPYELYLIHYLVINSLNEYFNGHLIGYFLTFIISILLAFVIKFLSDSVLSSITKPFTTG